MKAYDLLSSFENIHDKYIMEAKDMEKYREKKSGRSRVKYMLIAAIVAVSLMIVTAVAAMNYMGMQEITKDTPYAVPSEAAAYIETQSAQATMEDWSCTMLESLFDGGTFTISIGVSGGEKYILIPDYCGSGDDVSEIGLPSGQTLGDYAAQQGKTLLCVSGNINDRDKLGIVVATELFKSQSDGEATIVITGQKSSKVSVSEGSCSVVTRIADQNDVTRAQLPFTVKEAASEEMVYVADEEKVIAGIRTNSFKVIQSPAGTTIVFDQDFVDGTFPEDLKCMDIDGLTYGEGGWIDDGNGSLECSWARVQGTFSDTMTLKFVNWDNEIIGSVTFHRQK